MRETHWTPGPWVTVWNENYWQIDTARDGQIGDVCASQTIFRDGEQMPDADALIIAEANCRLIASAPDLYAALGALMAPWEGVPDGDLLNVMWGGGIPPIDLLIAARTALAAARGETP